MRRIAVMSIAVVLIAGVLRAAAAAPVQISRPLADPDGIIRNAVMSAMEGKQWFGLDGHLHTDHSHDAGFFHQQEKRPENHDTFVAGQLAEVARQGEDFGVLTDHRTYDQAYSPDYHSDSVALLDGEEWGGGRHVTGWGLSEILEEGPDDGVCGIGRAVFEAHAQDAVFGPAHPADGQTACLTPDKLATIPIDHFEAFRAPNTDFWARAIEADHRLAPATGSDNHFMQLYGSEGGPGFSTTYVLAEDRTPAAFLDGFRKGRAIATTRTNLLKMTTLIDGDNDGSFDATTGDSVVPAPGASTVRVAFRVQGGSGLWLQIRDQTRAIIAQLLVTLPDDVVAFDLPANAAFYRGELNAEPVQRVTGPSYLDYFDTMRLLSAPVYLTPEAAIENGTQAVAGGEPQALSNAPWAGFPRASASGADVHVVFQQRNVPVYEVAYVRSADGGVTWSTPVVLSEQDEDARTPVIAADGDRVTLVYERHPATKHGGDLVVRTSLDGGETFGDPEVIGQVDGGSARPSIATAAGRDHLVWMSMEDGYKIRGASRVGDGAWTEPRLLSSNVSYDGLPFRYVFPPRAVRWTPAAVHPVVRAQGDRVAVAWEDDREDPTPLRRGTPDDWGIYATFSSDGGQTWSTDRRISPRHDRVAGSEADPEKLEGNPARHADLLFTEDGALYLSYQFGYPTRGANVYVQRSDDGGATFGAMVAVSAVTEEFAYRPQLTEAPGGVAVLWQASQGIRWNLRSSVSSDRGASFSTEAPFTTGSGYAGFPVVAGGRAFWTGEAAGAYRIFTAAR